MTQADQFFLEAPPVPEGAEIVCIGVSLEAGPDAWRRAALPFTTDAEQRQAQRFLHPIDGVRHLVGRGLARWVMRGIVGNVVGDFTITPHGKPVCAGAGADFSISHSGNLVWVAFAGRGHVGEDGHEIRARAIDIAQPYPDSAIPLYQRISAHTGVRREAAIGSRVAQAGARSVEAQAVISALNDAVLHPSL